MVVLAFVIALGGCAEKSTTDYIADLEDGRSLVRARAARALGETGGARAVAPLIATLSDGDKDVRSDAAQALGEIGDARAVVPLSVALSDEDENVRKEAAEALGKIGDARAVDPLASALSRQDQDLRYKAALALGKIGDPRAVDPLVAALKNDSCPSASAQALGKIGDPRAVDSLIAALKTHGYQAALALGKIGDPRAVDPLIAALENDSCPLAPAQALGEIGDPRAVDPLIAALRDEYYGVRENAAEALGKIGDARAMGSLVDELTDTKINSTVANSLQKLGWQPDSKTDQIHWLIVRRDAAALRTPDNWPTVKHVLLRHVHSGDIERIEFALQAFTGIGKEDILPELLRFIRTKGTKRIAEAYLNCNHGKLRQAGRVWAREHGYSITQSEYGVETWNWGGW